MQVVHKRSLIRVWPAMLTFAFADELFKFQFRNPAFDLLFQFPSRIASAHPIPLCLIFNVQKLCGGRPPLPLKSFFKKPARDVDVRKRRRGVQVPVPQPGRRPVVPKPAEDRNSLTGSLVVIVAIVGG